MIPVPKIKPKALVFDLDGTLLDSMAYHVKGWRQALAEHGQDIPEEFFYLNEGSLDHKVMSPVRQKIGSSQSNQEFFETLLARQRQIYNSNYASQVKLYEQVPALIETIKKMDISLALVTSSNKIVLMPWLNQWLNCHFQVVITGDMVDNFKPHPEPYLKALKALEIKAEEAVAVENAPAGAQSALNAGIFTIAITTTLNASHFENLAPTARNHQELINWLNNFAF